MAWLSRRSRIARLAAIDRIKTILDGLEKLQHEPAGDDADVIGKLNRAAARAWNPRWQDDRPAASERIAGEVVFESANTGAPRSLAESGEGAGSVPFATCDPSASMICRTRATSSLAAETS